MTLPAKFDKLWGTTAGGCQVSELSERERVLATLVCRGSGGGQPENLLTNAEYGRQGLILTMVGSSA